MTTMLGGGAVILGALFCLLGTVVLAALAFVGLRYFTDRSRDDATGALVGSLHSSSAERVGR